MTEADIEATLVEHLTRAFLIDNPMWDYVKDLPHDDLLSFGRNGGAFTPSPWDHDGLKRDGTMKAYRDYVTTQWAWAIPSPETLAYISSVLNGRPIVEVGAGSGYWAWMLTQMGHDVVAYDKAPIGHEKSWFGDSRVNAVGERFANLGVVEQEYFPVKEGGPEMLPHEDSDRVLMLVWPPYGGNLAALALQAYRGDTLIYVGEGAGGCTGDDDFFNLIGEEYCYCDDEDIANGECKHHQVQPIFEEVSDGPLTQWGGIHDRVTVYKRI